MEFHLRSIQNLQWAKLPSWIFYPVYAIAYLCILHFFQYQTDVDTIGYIAAAEHYASGSFFEGINGYWSPLLSWLLVPFLWLNIPALLAIKLIDLAAGIVGLRLIELLSQEVLIKPSYTRWSMLVAMPHLAMFSLCASTPDVLACVSWLAVTYATLQLLANPGRNAIGKLSASGVISYVAKYYHFYAFLLLLAVFMLIAWLYLRNKQIILAFLKTAALFLFLSSIWVCAIYFKHGVFTPTTAAGHNLHTSQQKGAVNYPQKGEHILPLSYDRYIYTAWEYVPDYVSADRNAQTPANADIRSLLGHTLHNITKGPAYFYLETALLLLSLVVLFRPGTFRTNRPALFLLLIMLLYPLGYYVTAVDYRYLLFCIIGVIILAVLALQHAHAARQIMIGILLAGSFLLPFHRIDQFAYKGGTGNAMNNVFNTADQLRGKHLMSSPATWSRAIALAYQSKAKYYDTLLPEKLQTNNHELKQYHISYYLCLKEEIPDELKHASSIDFFGNYALIHLSNE